MKTIALILSLGLGTIIYGQLNIIPQPVDVKMGSGTHAFKTPLQIVYDDAAKNSATFLSEYLKKIYNVECKLSTSSSQGRDAYHIMLMVGGVDKKGQY